MAHYAKLGINSKVIAVHVVADKDCQNADGIEDEEVGRQFLENIHNWPLWKQTSYNTSKNTHSSGDASKALRGNYAGIGFTWDEDNQIFWPTQPHASWTKNTSTAGWDAPITYPSVVDDGADPVVWNYDIEWDESAYQADNSKGWKGKKENLDPATTHSDASKTYDWNGSAWVEA